METPRDEKLTADLRALRPTPRPEFAAELDERAAAGFPRHSRWPRLSWRMPSPMRILIPAGGVALIAIAIATAVLTASDGGKVSSEDLAVSRPEPTPAGKAPHQPHSTEFSTETPAAPSAGSAGAATEAEVELKPFSQEVRPHLDVKPGLHNRAVERSAELVLGADPADVADDASKVFEAVHAHDGIVMRSSTREGEPGVAGARFELLIPSTKLSDALAALSGIDEVRSRHEATDDITAPTVQTGELLQDSKARIDSLLVQLEAAETESEREAVEDELAAERRHRARLRAQLQNLERRANYSRVLVRIETGGSHDSSGGGTWGVDDALGDAGHILAVAAAVAVVALAILGPIALVALLAWLTHRAWVRRERRRVLS
jgi:Domain of unknown function (DUF4349)